LIFLALAISTGNISAQESWAKVLPGLGSFSSPRVADLNNDSIGDIILGAGRAEFLECDSAVLALDGKTGELLWNVSARDQIFGSATLADITGDGIPDVFINGRSAELIAINGKSGTRKRRKGMVQFLQSTIYTRPESGWKGGYFGL